MRTIQLRRTTFQHRYSVWYGWRYFLFYHHLKLRRNSKRHQHPDLVPSGVAGVVNIADGLHEHVGSPRICNDIHFNAVKSLNVVGNEPDSDELNATRYCSPGMNPNSFGMSPVIWLLGNQRY